MGLKESTASKSIRSGSRGWKRGFGLLGWRRGKGFRMVGRDFRCLGAVAKSIQ